MAHFALKSPLRTHRMYQYDSLAVLGFPANCTHLELSSETHFQGGVA